MYLKAVFFILVLVLHFSMMGQGESNNWYFGFGGGLRFDNNGTVEVFDDASIRASEGVSAISDPDGRLLFYTDGRTIWNRDHEVMGNGDNLFGNEASTQSSAIVPLPQSPNTYYVFTIDATSPAGVRGRGLNYSVVDMTQDEGNGAVVQKNVNLLEDCTEKIAVVLSDCVDETLWILTLSTPTGARTPVIPPFPVFDTYHAFKMDANGVSLTSVASTFPGMTQKDQGYLRFSPDGSKLADARMLDGLFLADFDKNTGIVSNRILLDITSTAYNIPYGVEFSPNGQFLYAHSFKQRSGMIEYDSALLQFDVTAPDVAASQVVIEEGGLFRGALQLGVNGKIYRALSINFDNGYDGIAPIENGTSYLGVINDPNEKGAACNYEHNAVEIPGIRVRQGLPPLVQTFFEETRLTRTEDIVVNNSLAACINEPLVLEAQQIPGATYSWEKDGSTISTEQKNRIEVANANSSDEGKYIVTIARPNAEDCPITGEINVMVSENPSIGDISITVCDIGDEDGTDGIAETDLDQFFMDGDFDYTFYRSPDDLQSDSPITNTQAYRNTTPFEEVLYYRAENNAGCEDLGEVTLTVRELPELVIDESYLLCTDATGTLIEGPEGYDVYNWFSLDGGTPELVSSEQSFEVTMQGRYRLDARIVFMNNGIETDCPSSTEFEVTPSNVAVIDEIIVERFTDNDTSVEILVSGDGDYEFSADGDTYQDANIFDNVNAGTITFSVRDKNGCGVVTEIVAVEPDTSSPFPNFFTPNSDGTNDTWQVTPAPEDEEVGIAEIRIFDRYGKFLIKINPDIEGWDGQYYGTPMPESDYWFVALKDDGQQINGHFSLKR